MSGYAWEGTVNTDDGPQAVEVRVSCNSMGEWSVYRTRQGCPAEWAAGFGDVGDAVSLILEGQVERGFFRLMTMTFPDFSQVPEEQPN